MGSAGSCSLISLGLCGRVMRGTAEALRSSDMPGWQQGEPSMEAESRRSMQHLLSLPVCQSLSPRDQGPCSLALEVAVITGLPEGHPVPSFLRVSRQEWLRMSPPPLSGRHVVPTNPGAQHLCGASSWFSSQTAGDYEHFVFKMLSNTPLKCPANDGSYLMSCY